MAGKLTEAERDRGEQAVLQAVERNWGAGRGELLEAVADALAKELPHYTGVYLYLLEGEMLVLHHYRGRPTEHTRIPIGVGVCGRAARVKATVTVDDVTTDPEYIACSLETRSEIVVPIMRGGHVFGEIDIDSDIPAAFDARDRRFLEGLAERLQAKFEGN